MLKKILVLTLVATAMLSACSSSRVAENELYKDDADRYAKNIVVKEKTPYSVVYEYRDVRIDEIASLAGKYCHKEGKRAFLQESGLYKNNRMRTTFICANLQ